MKPVMPMPMQRKAQPAAAKPGAPPVYRPVVANPPATRLANPAAQPKPVVVQTRPQVFPANRNSGMIVQRSRPVAAAVEKRPAPPLYRPQAGIGVQSKRPAPPIKALQNQPPAPAAFSATRAVNVQRAMHRAGPAAAAHNGSAVQRQLDWVEGARARTNNIAYSFLHFVDFGITPLVVNGQSFPGGGNLDTALHAPALMFEQKDGHVELSVAAEIVNDVGYRMELPSSGPWTSQDNIKRVSDILADARHSPIGEDLLGDGSATVTVEAKGLPNDAEFAQRVERHENFHVNDIREKLAAILVPWDRAIRQFMQQGRKIIAETQQKAEEKFYAEIGGTPKQVLKRVIDALRASGLAFHQSAKGRSPWMDSYIVADTVSGKRVTVYWDMPKQ